MKKLLVFLSLFIALEAHAQTVEKDLVGLGMKPEIADYLAGIIPAGAALDNNVYLKSDNAAGSGSLDLLKADASDNTILNGKSGKLVKVDIASTPEATFGDDNLTFIGNTGVLIAPTSIALSAGLATTPNASIDNRGINFSGSGAQPYYPVGAIITPSTSFPTPNAGDTLTQRYSRIVAGAPTATFVELPAATANVGSTFSVTNESSNPLAIVPKSGNTANLAAAATPFSCTTLKWCDCTATTTANWQCRGS